MLYSTVLMAAGLTKMAIAGYSIADDYISDGFFGAFDFFTGDDPTNGYVNYVDAGTASSNGYTKTNSDGSVYIGVDYNNVASGRGRDSVRLSTQKTYTHMLAVVDVGHMPGGVCGTWPAFWSFGSGGSGWPSEGEIDIIEGANDQSQNFMTLHSSPGCSITSSSTSLIQSASQDCDTSINGNDGCSFHDSASNSYGAGFNANGGGVYATEWTSAGVSMWFFPRGTSPSDALGANPDPSGWGTPTATWGGSGCDWDEHFLDHNLIFDTTFCGDWAANSFQSCGAANGGQTCQQFVQNNPSAFKEAYWQVNALKVYQDNGQTIATSQSPSATPTSTPVSTSAASSTPSGAALATSAGGVFLPSPISSSTSASTTPATTPSPTPTPSPSPTPTSAEVWDENSTGGIWEPAATSSAGAVDEGSDGEVHVPGSKREVGTRAAGRRKAAHLRRHGVVREGSQ